MIKSKRRINKAMLVAGVIPFISKDGGHMAFYSVKHKDFLAVPASNLAIGWRDYGWMAGEADMGGRWADDARFHRMGYKRVTS